MNRLLHILSWIENATLIGLLGVLILLAGAQIVFRNVLDLSVLGVDPILRMLVLWVAMLGAVAASRENRHISVDLFSRLLPARALPAVRTVTDAFTVVVCLLMAWHAARFVVSEHDAGGQLAGLFPVWVAELILPLAFGLIALRYSLFLGQHLRETFTGRSRPA